MIIEREMSFSYFGVTSPGVFSHILDSKAEVEFSVVSHKCNQLIWTNLNLLFKVGVLSLVLDFLLRFS